MKDPESEKSSVDVSDASVLTIAIMYTPFAAIVRFVAKAGELANSADWPTARVVVPAVEAEHVTLMLIKLDVGLVSV